MGYIVVIVVLFLFRASWPFQNLETGTIAACCLPRWVHGERVLRLQDFFLAKSLEDASDEINSTAWSDQQLLAAADDDRKVRVYDGAQDR